MHCRKDLYDEADKRGDLNKLGDRLPVLCFFLVCNYVRTLLQPQCNSNLIVEY